MRNMLDAMPGSARHFDEMSMVINRAVNDAGYYENPTGVHARDWCTQIRNSLAWQAQQKTSEYLGWFNEQSKKRPPVKEINSLDEVWARVSYRGRR